MKAMISLLDSTLREGEQTPGVCFSPHVKVAIARMLDELGIDVIETGHPAVTPAIEKSIRRIAGLGLGATVGAHARSLKSDVDQALDCGVGFLGIFYCVSEARLGMHAVSLNEAVGRVAGIIRHARERAPDLQIRYTPEDTVRSPWENVVTAAVEAAGAGADIISIADTAGHMIPGTKRSMFDYVGNLRAALENEGLQPRIAVHCHNDRGLAVANALDAFRAGADVIDVSVLGLGERAGITDLATLMAVLNSDFSLAGRWNLDVLPGLYEMVSRYAGVPVPVNSPVVGANAFTHCAGVHTQAALSNPTHYQSLDPAPFGREPVICLDHMSGMSALRHSLDRIGAEQDNLPLDRILARVKDVGQAGRTVDHEELGLIVDYCRGETPDERLAEGGAA